MSIEGNIASVRQRIAVACESCKRDPSSVTLIAVSKQQPIDRVLAAYESGLRDFGENTAQGLVARAEAFSQRGLSARWHFIGHLQRNKVNAVLRHVSMVHSVDRDELVSALAKRAPSPPLPVLVQVNIGREATKNGVDPDDALAFARRVAVTEGLRLVGLMGIAPAGVDALPFFSILAFLSDDLRRSTEGKDARALSMGMTDDFELAIRCGATMVRVGSAIFGPRGYGECP